MTLRDQTCCFTGHRGIPAEQIPIIQESLKDAVRGLVGNGGIYYGAGGALGFDTLAARCILELKEEFPQIRLILVLPRLSQAAKWKEYDQAAYGEIKARVDKCRYISHEHTRDCMFKRDRHLADNSGTCICYLTQNRGGTTYTVDYAKGQRLRIINLADE